MQFTVRVNSDNADVIREGDGDASFAAEALQDIARRIIVGDREGAVRDGNGNRVGRWSVVTGTTDTGGEDTARRALGEDI